MKQEDKASGHAIKELRVAVPDGDFDDIVAFLRKVWVVPKLPGIRGCDPCRSGLDRLIIEDPAFRNFGG